MADMHRLGDVRRAEIQNDGALSGWFAEEEIFAAGSRGERGLNSNFFEPEIEKTCPSDVDLLANRLDIEFSEHIRRELARTHLARFRQEHERVGLEIAELGIRAGPDLDNG